MSSIVLARLLEPEAFGLVAMLGFFFAIVQAIGDFGLSNSLIQKKDITEEDKSTVFWVTVGMGAVMATGYFMAADWVAHFYGQGELGPIMRWISLTLFLDSLSTVQRTLLKKEINFKKLALLRVASVGAAGVMAIVLACLGWGVWALVAQSVSSTLLLAVFYWGATHWRPRFVFSFHSIRTLSGVGLPVFGANMVDFLVARIDGLLIGKWFGPADVGYYSRGASLTRMPVQYLVSGVQRTIFPLLASIQDQSEKLEKSYRKATDLAGFWIFPVSFGLAAVAQPLVSLLYGAKWLPSVPLVTVLALSGPLLTWSMIQVSLLIALGHAGEVFRQSLWRSVFLVAGLCVGSHWGLLGMVTGRLAAEAFTGVLRCRDVEKVGGRAPGAELRRMVRPLVPALMMGATVWGVERLLTWHPALELGVLCPLGAVVYLIASWWLQRESLTESWHLGRTLFRRRGDRTI